MRPESDSSGIEYRQRETFDGIATAEGERNAPAKRLFGHPQGVFFLAAVELWERFSYYGMRASLVLYLQTDVFGAGRWRGVLGVGLVEAMYGVPADDVPAEQRERAVQALVSQMYGLYTSLCYLTPVLGGLLSDRAFGLMPVLYAGCACITLGHCLMVYQQTVLLALLLIAIGTGLFKPNASTLVGQLYPAREQVLRDSGYSIFYCSINAGAFLAPLVCGSLRPILGYHAAFAAAGVGMGLSTIMFTISHRCGVFTIHTIPGPPDVHHQGTSTGLLLQRYKSNFLVIGFVCIMSIIFWSVYEQSGNTIVMFVNRGVDRDVGKFTVPTEWFQSINPFFIIVMSPILAWIWQQGNVKRSSLTKMAIGSCLAGLAYMVLSVASTGSMIGNKMNAGWMVLFVLIMTLGEIYLSPVGLSFISQTAPPGTTSMMMGIWYLGSSVGHYLGGILGTYYGSMSHDTFFAALALLAGTNGMLMGAISGRLQRMLTPARIWSNPALLQHRRRVVIGTPC